MRIFIVDTEFLSWKKDSQIKVLIRENLINQRKLYKYLLKKFFQI